MKRSISSATFAFSLLALCVGCNDRAAEHTTAAAPSESHPGASQAAADPAGAAAAPSAAHAGSTGPQYAWGAQPSAAAGGGTAAAAPSEAQPSGSTGTVRETMNAGGYTYMRLETATGTQWVATTEMPVAVGQQVEVSGGSEMPGFHSPTLNRTFEQITFAGSVRVAGGTGAGPAAGAATAAPAMPAGHPGMAAGALPPGHPAMDPSAMPAGHPGMQPGSTEHQSGTVGNAGPLPAGAANRPLPPGHPPI